MDVRTNTRPRLLITALGGLVIGVFALAVAEFTSGLNRRWRSPVLDVGDRVIDRVPVFLKDLAIDWFGTNDKLALLIGIGTILAAFAVIVVGVVGLGINRLVGFAGVAAFGLIGAWAANSRRESTPWHVVVPSLLGAIAAAAAFWAVDHRLRRQPASERLAEGDTAASPGRRELLTGAGALVVSIAVVSGPLAAIGRRLAGRFQVGGSRDSIVLPTAADPAGALPAGTDFKVKGLSPFVTPNADFYRIDTALTAPQVPIDGYTLKIHGMVDKEIEFTYEDLLELDLIERDITLSCVSNQVGGQLAGNARWLGVRLTDLLDMAGVQAEADQVVGRSTDGYTCGFPMSVATDGRDAMVAFGMNGEPLPVAHGFPVRLVVPGLYGYLSATKWLTEIELTTFDAFDHYWARRGYATEAPIKLFSRIDTPRGLASVPAGTVPLAGVAWAQTTGISGVEVKIDDGDWTPAELAAVPSADTWVQWKYDWDAPTGRHNVAVRAIDEKGAIQTADRTEPLPDGATGHHSIVVIVK